MPHKLELRAECTAMARWRPWRSIRARPGPMASYRAADTRVVPPTPERVSEFLKVVGLSPPETLGAIPTREVVVTADNVANFYHMACVTIQTSDLPTLSPFMVPAYPPAMESRSAHPSPVP